MLVCDIGAELLGTYKYRRFPTGYFARNIPRSENGGTRGISYLHRDVLGAEEGVYVDHVNGDVLDNRRGNLRICTNGENLQNSRAYKGRVGMRGVYPTASGKFMVLIRVANKQKYIGTFSTKVEAVEAWNAAALQRSTEFAVLNGGHE